MNAVATALRCLLALAALLLTEGASIDKKVTTTRWSGTYVIAVPKALQPTAQHSVSVQIQRKNVGLRIDSTNPDSNKTVEGELYVFPTGDGVTKYQVPFPKYAEKAIKLSFVAYDCGPAADMCASAPGDQLFVHNVTLPILKDTVLVFIETSKPIYKPGDTIQFRILPLSPRSLHPQQSEAGGKNRPLVFDLIYLEAPNKMRMAQWSNVSWQQTLEGMSFVLSADPLFGSWKIVSQIGSDKDEHSFRVEKYVLPKFTVTPMPPKFVYINDSDVKFSVCAAYSTGRPMKGLVKAELCIKRSDTYYRSSRKKRPCIRVTGVLDGSKRCAEFTEKANTLQLRSLKYWNWGAKAFLNATVIESGTDKAITSTAFGGKLDSAPFKIVSKIPANYRSNLPFYGKVLTVNHDGTPRPNENVTCRVATYWGSSWGFSESFKSDADGVINFGIPPFPSESNSVSIQCLAPQVDTKDDTKVLGRRQLKIVNPAAFETLKRVHSPSNTHIQLYPLDRLSPQSPCSSGKLTIRLQSNVPLHDRVIYTLSTSRGDIQETTSFGPTDVPEVKCQNQDSIELGHYTCVPQKDGNMKIRCLPGWRGPNCMTPICENGCVKGVCRAPGNCVCQKGWSGDACNKCMTRKNCKNGYCHRGNDCYCRPGYRGSLCNLPMPEKFKYYYNRNRRPPVDTLPIKEEPKYDPSTQLEDLELFTRELEIPISTDFYPSTKVVVWFLHEPKEDKQEFVATNFDLQDLQECFKKAAPTSFSFDRETVRPGERVTASVQTSGTAPKCALAVTDIALDTFGGRGGITYDNLFQEIDSAVQEMRQWHHLDPFNTLQNDHCMRQRKEKRRVRRFIIPDEMRDASSFFKQTGFFVVSNIPIVTAPCRNYFLRRGEVVAFERAPQPMMTLNADARGGIKAKSVAAKKKEIKARVRTFFPEAWKFELLKDPKDKITMKAPDSMTTWKSTMYCVSSKGLGVSPPDKLVVFQPFFLQMSLPYSLIRNEVAKIPVKVFSYRKECSEITLRMKPTEHLKSNGAQVVRACVCNFDQVTAYFRVQPTKLGKVPIEIEAVSGPSRRCPNPKSAAPVTVVADAVRRQLLVEPEGVPEQITVGDLLCPSGKTSSIKLSLEAPQKSGLRITEGSERAYLTWSGNVIGSSLENLDSLVRMPYGCGEQNMMSMVPSIYVLDYFTRAGIKNAQVKAKALKFISIGYQRQLNYRLDDGSYSAFGKRDKMGSTWLTAFVFKSFVAASRYAPIDSPVLTSALSFLMSKTRKDGCFREDGRVFSSSLKGGQGRGTDEVSITAYILSSLLEANAMNKNLTVATRPAILAAERCLNVTTPRNAAAMKNISNYAVALRAYALTMWKPNHNLTKRFRQELKRREIKKDGFVYWKANDKEKPPMFCRPWSYFVSADVETTAYGLLCRLIRMGSSGNELLKALPTLRWLTSQKNERGGWYSTQDTVMALQALSTFAARTSSSGQGTNLEMTLKTDDKKSQIVSVTEENKLVLSKMAIAVPNTVSVSVKGSGCLVVQASVLFNVMDTGRVGAPFTMTASATQDAGQCKRSQVRVCVRYTGPSKQSGMAVVKARMASGWQVTGEAVEQLNANILDGGLKLIEVDPDKTLVLYFDSFTPKDSCVKFEIERKIEVGDVKPMVIQVYDYYKPHEVQEQSVQVVSKSCNKKSQQSQDDAIQAKCPVCTIANDTAEAIVKRLCSKPHYYAGIQRKGAVALQNMWRYTQRVGDMILTWNAALTVPKGCTCPIPSRAIVAVHTNWWALSIDEAVTLDQYWTVINVDSLSPKGQKKLASSCAAKSESFAFVSRLLKKEIKKPMKQPNSESLFGPQIEPPESMCFSCVEHFATDVTLQDDQESKDFTLVRVTETVDNGRVVWEMKDLNGKSYGKRNVDYQGKKCSSTCKYQSEKSKKKELLVISRKKWKLQISNEDESIVPDGSFYIDEFSKMRDSFPNIKKIMAESSNDM